MLELRNLTPFSAAIVPALDKQCLDYVVVVVKGSFDIENHGELVFSGDQKPVTFVDEYFGEEGASSIRYAADSACEKNATDIVLGGHARSPDEKPCYELDIQLSIGELRVNRRIYGDRFWEKSLTGWQISEPTPFTAMPLIYENAYGGVHELENGELTFHAANPVGKGFVAENNEAWEGLALPNIEDPSELIHSWKQRPDPAGLGFIAPGWTQRSQYAGTYDETWQQNRSPLLPEDFDERFFNAAHPDLIHFPKLGQGEPVYIDNVRHDGPLQFSLPSEKLWIVVSQSGVRQNLNMALDTVIIEPDDMRVQLVWRARIPAKRKMLDFDWITVKGNY